MSAFNMCRLVFKINLKSHAVYTIKSTLSKYSRINSSKFTRFPPLTLSTSTVFSNKEVTSALNHLYLKDVAESALPEDSQYPEWLWQLNKHKRNLEELDPQSKTYRRLLRKKTRRDENERRKMKRF